jgi:hypothetical protein
MPSRYVETVADDFRAARRLSSQLGRRAGRSGVLLLDRVLVATGVILADYRPATRYLRVFLTFPQLRGLACGTYQPR